MKIVDIGYKQIPKKFNLLSPIGGFGNHVRWLLLLDPVFQFIVKDDRDAYDRQRGTDWPEYDDYRIGNWNKLLPEIKKEILDKCSNAHFDNTTSKKFFIQKQIYHQTRTWNNWLNIEWTYRNELDFFIELKHEFSNLTHNSLPVAIFTIDPELALKCYLKFNNNLNSNSAESFKKNQIKSVKKNLSSTRSNSDTCILDAGILYQPTLDYNFYTKLINWANLSNQYEAANFVHGLWYQAHKKAEEEFANHINAIHK